MAFASRTGGCWLTLNAGVQSRAGDHDGSAEALVGVATQRLLLLAPWARAASTRPPVLVLFLEDSEVDSVAGVEASVEDSVIEELAARGQVLVIKVAVTDSAVKLHQMLLQVQEVVAMIGEEVTGTVMEEGQQAVTQSR